MCSVRTLVHVLCLTITAAQVSNGLSFSVNNYTRVRRETSCPEDLPFALPSFPCNSGECVDGSYECNGHKDCKDGSDETDACKRIQCASFLFTCNYGACIKKELQCNGVSDCADNSDESSCPKANEIVNVCTDNEFRCSSGQCINKQFKCDGKADCIDQTDEIKATCFDVECPGTKYKCDYGACTVQNAECNGVVDCFDGSDEAPSLCTINAAPGQPPPSQPSPTPRPPSAAPGSCVLPAHPGSGHWSIFGVGNTLSPGSVVTQGTILNVECDKGYLLDGNITLYCRGGEWSANVGRCQKVCPVRNSTPNLNVTCIYQNKQTQNCTEAIDGTLAKFKCASFYEDFGLNRKPVHICQDGNWDQREPKCEPVCGQKTVEATPLIIEGTNVTKGEYPWQVALYRKSDKALICGGSLLNQRVILTAAHCVTDQYAELLSKENYFVAVGKYYNKHDDKRDTEAQFSELHSMHISEEYRGDKQNYLGDIAILVTVKVFTLSRRVQPVCLDAGLNFNIARNEIGYVTGWGFTVENSAPSDVLKELKVPAVDTSQCRSELPEDYDIYLTHDKMCAGYIDKGTSVCRGDSGGGLVFKHDGRYWITGIVSIAPTSPENVSGCDSSKYGLYTKVSNYVNSFILKMLAKYKTFA
ncbi:modular serine protease-like [Zophobas morio]|uniref:modular serine protease-like n=1 Tax=Zophobas morio TaxID=2755281 RepID=UPI003082EBFE